MWARRKKADRLTDRLRNEMLLAVNTFFVPERTNERELGMKEGRRKAAAMFFRPDWLTVQSVLHSLGRADGECVRSFVRVRMLNLLFPSAYK